MPIRILQEVRGDVVLVQFNIPALPALLTDRDALLIQDNINFIIDRMTDILRDQSTTLAKQKEADELMLRTIRYLTNDENRQGIEKLIRLYARVPRPYKPAE